MSTSIKTKRYYNTDVHTIKLGTEIRLDSTVGIPGKREDIRKMYGTPRNNEITAFRMNLSFYNSGDSKSEELGPGRGDCFINVAYDGKRLFFEPDIPSNGMIWEAPTAYRLLRNGNYDYSGEQQLKSITNSNPRTMLGQTMDGTIYAMVSEGRKLTQKGLTANEQRAICFAMRLHDAVNADGGGSSVAFLYDTQIGRAWDYRLHGRIIVGYAPYTSGELPTLRRKWPIAMRGVYVHLLQRLLGITADGIFGNDTLADVIDFQGKHGLKKDGIVGPMTWKALTRGVIW